MAKELYLEIHNCLRGKAQCALALCFVWASFFFPLAAHAGQQTLPFEFLFANSGIQKPSELSSDLTWNAFDPQKNNLAPQKQQTLWLRVTVNSAQALHQPTLKLEKVFMRFRVFSEDNEVIYSFGDGKGYAGFPPHLVTLASTSNKKIYYFRIESEHQRIGPVGTIEYGQRSDFILKMLTSDLILFFVCSILALLSLAGSALYIFYRNVSTYLYLALFSACACVYIFAGVRLRQVLGLDPGMLGNLSFLALFCAPYFFLQFYKNIFSIKTNLWMKAAIFVNIIFVIITCIGMFASNFGLLPFLTSSYFVSVPIFSGIFIHSIARLRDHPYSKTFYLGLSILLFSGLWEMANEVKLINSNFRMLHIGILLFFMCLTAMQGQFFANLFRTAKRNEQAEIASRVRLQHVLDCTYALAQTRNYRELIRTVAAAITDELNISKLKFTVDFMISKSFVREHGSSDDILHFSYVATHEGKPGEIFEVRGSETQSHAHSPGIEETNKHLTSLPGILTAGEIPLSSANLSPHSIVTIPLGTEALDGAVIIRRYDDVAFAYEDQRHLVKFVNAVSASLLIALKNIDYVAEVKMKAILDSQLDAAETIQSALRPPPLNLKNVAFSSYTQSAGKTGGDWFGYFFSPTKNRLFITIGDVTGHDFAASILTGVVAGVIKGWEFYDSDRFESASEALQQLATHVNRVLCDSTQQMKFMTMIFLCLELETGRCHLVNAGHPHPFHIPPQTRPQSIVASGSILGENPNAIYISESIDLSPLDSLMLYTDGLLENTGPEGERISRRSLNQFSQKSSFDSRNLDNFVSFVKGTWKSQPLEDDATIVIVTWKPKDHRADLTASEDISPVFKTG